MVRSRFSLFTRDEAVVGMLLGVHLLLSVVSIVLGKAARDALFLSRYSPQVMMRVDIATVMAAAAVVAVQLRLGSRMSTRRVLLLSPLCFAAGDIVLCCALKCSLVGSVIGATYVWMGVQASIAAPQASILACQALTLRQTKRLCGPVGAGAILGWIGGGLLTQALVTRYGTASLLLGSALATGLCPLIVRLAWRNSESLPADCEGDFEADGETHQGGGLRRSASSVWNSPHLRAVAFLALVSSAVTTIVGLQFKVVASQTIGATDHLAAFFGQFSM